MTSARSSELRRRVQDRIRHWRVVVEREVETPGSVIVFGQRASQPVALKVVRSPGDEWHSGETLDHFDGRGMVRVYDYEDGAVLMEHLLPGESLVKTALNGKDDEQLRSAGGSRSTQKV